MYDIFNLTNKPTTDILEGGKQLDILKYVIDTKQAAELWNMSADRVKHMCQNGEIKAKKIGNSWAVDATQPNPKKYKLEEIKMAKLFYEDILVSEITTNRSLNVQEALDQIEFDERKFIEENGFEGIDYNDFRLEY